MNRSVLATGCNGFWSVVETTAGPQWVWNCRCNSTGGCSPGQAPAVLL
jgi:hypothetical protein